MRLSIIIVNYNVKYFLYQCLASVRDALKNIDAEVFMVDNLSSDGSVDMVAKKFPWVKIIANQKNVGFGFANNQAMELAKGTFILLLNPDTIVAEDTFEKVLKFMDDYPDAGGLGVKMIDGTGKFLPESKRGLPSPRVAFYKIFGLSVFFPRSKVFGRYHLGYLDPDETHEVDVLSGAFMLMRKSVIDTTGYFDEKFFMYGEDIDLSYRIVKAGYKNYYYPGATIIHYKGESTKKGSLNYVFVFYKAMIIFAKKHFTSQKAALFSILINAAVYLRAGIAIIYRFLQNFAAPLVDAALMFASMYLLKEFYEDFKFHAEGSYPPALMKINVPIYILFWLGGLYLSNVYQPKINVGKIIRGFLIGTIFISIYYAFTTDAFRFSRALILMGAVAGCGITIFWRCLVNLIENRHFSLNAYRKRNVILAGNKKEFESIGLLYAKNQNRYGFAGYVAHDQEEEREESFLGSIPVLQRIISLYKINEVIFSSSLMTWKLMIKEMGALKKHLTFKIYHPEFPFAIGSDSKNAAGEVITSEEKFIIAEDQVRYQKRAFDISFSLLALVLSPLLLFGVNNSLQFYKNIFSVLGNSATWVGYASTEKNVPIPKIKPGILDTITGSSLKAEEENFNYAKDYSTVKDLMLVMRKLNQLGNKKSLK